MSVTLDPARLVTFRVAIEGHRSKGVPLSALWEAFAGAFPARPQGREGRALLLMALRKLEAEGAVTFPSTRGRLWDRRTEPALPTKVMRAEPEREPGWNWRGFPWHPELHWVLDLPRPTASQLAFIRRVHEGLVEGWFAQAAPLRHRSLQLTGDEKQLFRLSRTALFGYGRLSLERLGCAREPTPLAWERVGDGDAMIIFENAGPFQQARETLAGHAAPPFGFVAYGGGGEFRHSVRYLATLAPRPRRLLYVGDLDRPGIRIAHAAAAATRESELPPLEPATAVHAAMLQRARAFGASEGWAHRREYPLSSEWLEWLDPAVRPLISTMLAARRRIPEEVLGPGDMRALWDSMGEWMTPSE